jgi:hypothetical protein
MSRHRKFRSSSRSSHVSSQSRKWYVYWPRERLVLSGYASREKAEAERAGKELNDFVMVLSRESKPVRLYAMMHPEFVRREGFKVRPKVYEPMRR